MRRVCFFVFGLNNLFVTDLSYATDVPGVTDKEINLGSFLLLSGTLGLMGWSATDLFVRGAQITGRGLTREKMINRVESLKNYNQGIGVR